MLRGKVLITGGAGFLGRGIIGRAHREGWPCSFTVLSRDEEKQSILQHRYPDVRCILGDVRDSDRLDLAFVGHDVVIHAGAVKFIPEAEYNVDECIAVNVQGSRNVARAAINAGVKTVIGISTDKAVLPVNSYGMTKALMERLYAQLDGKTGTRFKVTRYGNVIGSTGSVIPLFLQQKEERGKVLVTNEHMTRFWLTIDQAIDLVLRAYEEESIGAVIVPRCGAMRIVDLARLIADGSPIEFIGSRPGEKLHERLVDYTEAVRCVDEGDCYLLYPPTSKVKGGGEPWTYTSENPAHWVTQEEMACAIVAAKGV